MGHTPPTSPCDEPRDAGLADRDILLACFGGDAELLKEIAELFLRDCPLRLAAAHTAVAQHDAVTLARAAHSLRGSVANFAAGTAVAAARRLESAADRGEWAGIDGLLAELEAECTEVMRILRDLDAPAV